MKLIYLFCLGICAHIIGMQQAIVLNTQPSPDYYTTLCLPLATVYLISNQPQPPAYSHEMNSFTQESNAHIHAPHCLPSAPPLDEDDICPLDTSHELLLQREQEKEKTDLCCTIL